MTSPEAQEHRNTGHGSPHRADMATTIGRPTSRNPQHRLQLFYSYSPTTVLPCSIPESHLAGAATATSDIPSSSPSKVYNGPQRPSRPSKSGPHSDHLKARRRRRAFVTIFEPDTSSQAGMQIAHHVIVPPRRNVAAQSSDHGIHVTETTS